MGYILANKLVSMSIYTHNWESVINLNNRMLNIDKKTIKKNKKRKKRKKQIKKRFFHKKPFFIEIKNQKIKNGFLCNTTCDYTKAYSSRRCNQNFKFPSFTQVTEAP